MDVLMRRLRNRDELRAAVAVVYRQFPDLDFEDRSIAEAMENFERDRALMLCLEVGGEIRGAAIASGVGQVGLRALGMDPELRGAGFGRRLIEAVETEALMRDAREIVLGAQPEARGFYEHMGYRGKHTMKLKELPLPGAVRRRRAQEMAGQLGDLEHGVVVGRL